MIPPVISREIQLGIKSFLGTTFPSSTPAFSETLDLFLGTPGQVFKGPYFSLRLPFRPAPDGALPFNKVAFPYRPFLHQARAFMRLTGDRAQSTLVATGTGSGKTECFLYPILDACAARAGEPGIKAIIIYPMNALATDQARRVAQVIHDDPALKDRVTAGLFIGGEGDQATRMTESWLITDKGHMREHPPDILLTNYKMLDYLLIRPDEQSLWRDNGPETLRFLVVDELHTFDGAQSTDLACLIRRLKTRLRTPANHLCAVGTSATLGGADQTEALLEYAKTVFAEPFGPDSIIGEDVLTLADVTEDFLIRYHGVPELSAAEVEAALKGKDPQRYLAEMFRAWFGEDPPADPDSLEGRIALGEKLREHSFFRNVMTLAERSGRKVLSEEWLVHELTKMMSGQPDATRVRNLLDSFFSLCAHARYRDPKSGGVGPLLRVHVHLWMRELSRLVASAGSAPVMAFSDDLKPEALKNHLPVLHCRECGVMGWGGTMRPNNDRVAPGLQEFYQAFFGKHPTLRMLFPIGQDVQSEQQGEFVSLLCGHCLRLNGSTATSCAACGADDRLVRVMVHSATRRVKDQTTADTSCPYCESTSGLTILGSRAASLTSIALGQLYTSPFNTDKKSLAFSDNVQDASHRSGFFTARTYRVNVRTAIRRVVAAEGNVSLTGLEKAFHAYWHKQLNDADFVGLFLAPDMEWLSDFDELRATGKLPAGSDLPRLVDRRMGWELAAEFGFNSRIGRTLEKSGAAIASVEGTALEKAAGETLQALHEKAGGFGAIKQSEVLFLLNGLLHRLRTGGGIVHPALAVYLREGGETYMHNLQLWLPSFARFGRAPVFFYQGTTLMGRFERLIATGTTPTWSQQWAMKTLKSAGVLNAEAAGFAVEEAINALTRAGLLVEQNIKGNRVWGLDPEKLVVSCEVKLMRCDQCGHSISCAPSEQAHWTDVPCLKRDCGGAYHLQPDIEDYFGDLYRSGDVVRIRSAEHTGLLDREQREWLESRFMAPEADRRGTDPNLLSCTPTLEMGVNIGDLSSVVLCTVPPGAANYIQRVGRAGRKEGAAVSLTIASGQAHDLYYFQLPEDMIAGEIRPPGTFLDAPAVLERQFTAYCFDRWSERDNPRPILPHRLEPVLDTVKKGEDAAKFPYDFFKFIEANAASLLRGFGAMFDQNALSEDSRKALESFALGGDTGGGLAHRILQRLTGLLTDRDDLRSRLRTVGNAIRKNQAIAARDEALETDLKELRQTRDGTMEMLKQINSRLTLNFFTDEGLLPNYAFPEEGIELRSVILRKREKPKEGEGNYQALSYEYVRPAASAINELAPGSTFYVNGRRLKVDQVGLKVSPLETWHFCDNCSHMEPVDLSPQRSECPACNSVNWPDASLKRDLIRLRQVVSTEFDRNSRSYDDRDERQTSFFEHHESVVVPDEAERRAYQISGSSVPFGFEFLSKLTLRIVNLGDKRPDAHPFRLGGRERMSEGFWLCPSCGKVQSERAGAGEEEMKHDLTCPRRNGGNEPLQAVFLYRELTSEAIRVLLPSSGLQADSELTSFVAALHLGLRLYFKGNIDHLRGVVDERPIPQTSLRRKFLVIYDQVPGGTGYLKQLSQNPEVFLDVLRKALTHLQECQCATTDDHETDGCHRCILQSRHRRDHAELSRSVAIRLLSTILESADRLEPVKTVSDIDVDPLIQSELEKSFLESLRAEPGAQLQKKIVRGRPGYLWRCGDAAWEIGLQVDVPADQHVATPSRPDFILYPVRPLLSRPLAIFLDGYSFHADESAGRNRIARDIEQRQALVHSGKYWVWSFSWEDLQYRMDTTRIPAVLLGEEGAERRGTLARQLGRDDDLRFMQSVHAAGSWSLFMDFLQTPTSDKWQHVSALYALAAPPALSPTKLEAVTQVVDGIFQGGSPAVLPTAQPGDGLGASFDYARWCGLVATTPQAVAERDLQTVFLLLRFDDDNNLLVPDFAKEWRGFLRLLNRVQFTPWAFVTTTRGLRAGSFTGIRDAFAYFIAGGDAPHAPVTTPVTSGESTADADAVNLEFADERLKDLLAEIARRNLSAPEVGYELMVNDAIAATAELAWKSCQLAIVTAPEEADAFKQQKWTVVLLQDGGLQPHDDKTVFEILENKS